MPVDRGFKEVMEETRAEMVKWGVRELSSG